MAKRVKQKDHENLTDSNIKYVIEKLENRNPITKKAACELLNISYNTSRLSNIIESYKHQKEVEKKNRAKKRGTSATPDEIETIVRDYLRGESITEISKGLFRSTSFVKNIIERIGVPKKLTKEERKEPCILPDQCISETFEANQLVWSAKYNCAAIVREEDSRIDYESKYGAKCYKIYIMEAVTDPVPGFSSVETGGYTAYSLAFDLGSLEHLEEYCPSIKGALT